MYIFKIKTITPGIKMINQLRSIFYFYKTFFIWSLVINLIFVLLKTPDVFLVLIIKFLLLIFIYYVMIETKGKQKLTFYKILGISGIKLFSVVYVIDAIITLIFLKLILYFFS